MKKYYCDVCGEEMPSGYKTPVTMNGSGIEALCHVYDVCGQCDHMGQSVDVVGVLLDAWRKKVFPQPAEED